MELIMYAMQLAAVRAEEPGEDIVTKLIQADVDGHKLTDDEFGFFMVLLAVAGNDTTRTAISHGMHLLSQHPDQRKIWMDDMEPRDPLRQESMSSSMSAIAEALQPSAKAVTSQAFIGFPLKRRPAGSIRVPCEIFNNSRQLAAATRPPLSLYPAGSRLRQLWLSRRSRRLRARSRCGGSASGSGRGSG